MNGYFVTNYIFRHDFKQNFKENYFFYDFQKLYKNQLLSQTTFLNLIYFSNNY